MSNLHAFYLRDLGYLLREAGEAVKHDVAAGSDDDDRVFQQGRQMAYYEVLSLMQQQAYAFELPLSEIALDGLNPDHDLL